MIKCTCLLLLIVSVAVGAETWTIPKTWTGKKIGSTEGNPLIEGGSPRWRIDQVYPDKPEDLANWKPMQWDEVQKKLTWHNEAGSQGGHPQIRIEKGQCIVGVYSKATNMDWTKVPAVVFIAPRDGSYKMIEECTSQNWEGNGAVDVRFYRIDRAAGAATPVEAAGSSLCGDDKPRRGESRVVKLTKGDELAASFWIDGHHTGATITVSIGVATAKPVD